MLNFFKRTIVHFSLIIAVIFVTVSCDIGLGSSVDTNPPTVSITYPPENSIISDWFELSGQCDDDVALRSISVNFHNISANLDYSLLAQINDKTWKVEANKKQNETDPYPFADGTYTITVMATDTSGRTSTKATRSVDIDNTAPVLILSKPLSLGSDANTTSFGKVIKLAGDISEDHTTESLVLYAAKEADVPAGGSIAIDDASIHIPISDFGDMSADNPLILARYYRTSELTTDIEARTENRNKYLQIYGNDADTVEANADSGNDRTYYAALVLKDNAKKYQDSENNPEGEDNPNVTKNYYVKTSAYETLEKQYSLNVDNLKKYLGGALNVSETDKANIAAGLVSSTVSSEVITTSSSKFLVNPKNSPIVEVGGFEIGTGAEPYKDYNMGGQLTLTFTAGKDNVEIKPASVEVIVKNIDDLSKQSVILAEGDFTDSADTTVTKSLSIESDAGLEIGQKYKFFITGSDRDGNDLVEKDEHGYGFKVYSTSNKPDVTFVTEKDQYISGTKFATEGLSVTAKIKVDGVKLYNTNLSEAIHFYKTQETASEGFDVIEKNSSDAQTLTHNAVTLTAPSTSVTKNGNDYTINFTFGKGAVDVPTTPGIYKYTTYLYATDTNGKTGFDRYTFYVDNKAPELTINEPVPSVTKGSDKFVNGTFKITGTASDNYELEKVSYVVVKNGSAGTEIDFTDSIANPEVSIDTTKLDSDGNPEYPDGTTLKIKFIAKDRLENTTTKETAVYKVSQPTDAPVIEGYNFYKVTSKDNLSVNSETGSVIKGNVFDKNTKLSGKITDDDGLKTVNLSIRKEDGTVIDGFTKALVENGSSTSYSITNIALPSEAGIYRLYIDAVDTTLDAVDSMEIGAARKTELKGYRKTSFGSDAQPVYFAIDNETPQITETSNGKTDLQYKKSGRVLFGGVISDDWKLAAEPVTVKLQKLVVNSEGVETATDIGSINLTEGHGITTTTSGGTTTTSWEYEFDVDGTFDSTSIENAKYELIFTVTDFTGKTKSITRRVAKDSQAPAFGTTDHTASPAPAANAVKPYIATTASAEGWYRTNTLTIAGGVSDGTENWASGVSKIEITKDPPTDPDAEWTEIPGTSSFIYNLTIDTGDADKKDVILSLRATDKVGNVAGKETDIDSFIKLSAKIDTKNPTMAVSTVDGKAVSNDPEVKNGRSAVTVIGTATDAGSGIDKILININSQSFASPKYTLNSSAAAGSTPEITVATETGVAPGTYNWALSIPAADIKALNQGNNTVYARVYDKAGNYTDQTLFTLKTDSEKPTVSINPISSATEENNPPVVNGKITLNGTANDADLSKVDLVYWIDKDGNDTAGTAYKSWHYLAQFNSTEGYNWSTDIDTKEAFGTIEDDTIVYVCAVASDTAQNRSLDTTSGTGESATVTDNTELATFTPTGASELTFRKPLKTPEELLVSNAGSIKKIKVNQDSDRPVIKFTNLDLDGMTSSNSIWLKNIKTVIGTLTDDDEITKFEYKASTAATPETDWTQIPVSNGSWTLDLDDAGYTIKFRVTQKDSFGSQEFFESCADISALTSTDYRSPKLCSEKTVTGSSGSSVQKFIFGTNSDGYKDSQLYLKVDINKPESKNLQFAECNSEGLTCSAFTGISSMLHFGGVYTKFAIRIEAQDSNGINKVSVLDSEHNELKSVSRTSQPDPYNKPEYQDNQYHEWTLSDIDISTLNANASGMIQFTVVVEDNAGLKKMQAFSVTVDNKPAVLSVESHTEGTQVGDSFVLKGKTYDADDETTVKYIINSSATEIPATDSIWAVESTSANAPKQLKGSVSSWRLYVDGDVENMDGYTHEKSHKKLFTELYGSAAASGTPYGIIVSESADSSIKGKIVKKLSADDEVGGTELYTTIKTFYFHFLVTDANKNKSVETFNLKVDPQGDIPTIRMDYPTATTGTASGKIRAQGTASDNKKISATYIQIDPNYNSATGFNAALWQNSGSDKTAAASAVKAAFETALGTGKTLVAADYPIENVKGNIYAIKTSGTESSEVTWNYTLNKSSELNAASGNRTIALRLYVRDSDGNINDLDPADDVPLTIDSDKPKFGSSVPFYVYQYEWVNGTSIVYTNTAYPAASEKAYTDAGCRTGETAISAVSVGSDGTVNSITVGGTVYTKSFISREYEDNMWLNGEWWLSGSVEDESDIKSATVTPEGGTEYNLLTGTTGSSKIQKTWTNSGVETKGYIINYRIGSREAESFGTLSYDFEIEDNDEKSDIRSFSVKYDNKKPVLEAAGGTNFAIEKDVVNSNGFYTLGSAVYENTNESGFSKLVFFFKRTISGYEKVYDSYIRKDASGNALSYTGASADVEEGAEGLYWVRGTSTTIEGAKVNLNAATAAKPNIHKGGLVKFGGAYYVIQSKDSGSITLDSNPAETLAGSDIFFAIGHVVDQEAESPGKNTYTTDENYGYYSDSSDNTDDGMIESVATANGTTIWTGSINSNNIPDGSIEIYYVAFDKAGNFVKGSVTNAKVENNAPRIASVKIWYDFNGNNAVDAGETVTEYYSKRTVEIGGTTVDRSSEVTSKMAISGTTVNRKMLGLPATAEDAIPAPYTSDIGGNEVKHEIGFIPELVGGNGSLHYSYLIGTAAQFRAAYNVASGTYNYAGEYKTKAKNNDLGTGHDDFIDTSKDDSGYYRNSDDASGYILGHTGSGTETDSYRIKFGDELLKAIGNSTSASEPTLFDITIWDSTAGTSYDPESNAANPALSARIQVALNIQYTDANKPKVAIDPFFWKKTGSGNNSLYGGSLKNGHIEISEDLPSIFSSSGTGLMDRDPKVSGKITIRGTAYDDINLKTLSVSFDGHKNIGSKTLAATYTNGEWVIATGCAEKDSSGNVTTALSTNGWSFAVKDVYCNTEGHKAEWELNVDTAFIAKLADVDKLVHIYAVDARGDNPSDTTFTTGYSTGVDGKYDVTQYNVPSYKMDIVPYITAIKTHLSPADQSDDDEETTTASVEYNSDRGSAYNRTALGHYPIYYRFDGGSKYESGGSEEKVTVYGFNLAKAGKLENVTIKTAYSNTAVAGENGTAAVTGALLTADDETTGAKKGEWTLTVNGIKALNNINDNDATAWVTTTSEGTSVTQHRSISDSNYADYAYNRTPNSYNNKKLTDDVVFDIWDMNQKAAIPSGNRALDVMMEINPVSGMMGFAFRNNRLNWSMANGTSSSYEIMAKSTDFMQLTGFHFDSKGASYGTTAGGASDSGIADSYAVYSSRFKCTNNSFDAGKKIRIESTGQKGTKANTSGDNTNYLDKSRFKSPDFASLRNASDNATYLYLAYYDQMNKEVRFRAGTLLDTNTTPTGFDDFRDDYQQSGSGTSYVKYGTYGKFQIIADETGTSATLGKAGQYVSIAVTGNNQVVMVWFDGTKLNYAYNENPLEAHDDMKKSPSWTKVSLGGENATKNMGLYCQVAVDSDNHIHIAAFDNVAGALKYIYVPSYNGENAEIYTVDSYLTVGKQITLDVAKQTIDGHDYQIPHIGYWNGAAKKPAYAYLANPAAADKDGVKADQYTGVWECSIVPAASQYKVPEDRINVGVWKNAGVLTTSYGRTGATGTLNKTTKDSTVGTDSGKCYGNGTKNAALAYQITINGAEAYVETAQKR